MKDYGLLNKIQDFSLSERNYDGDAADRTDEYSYNVHIVLE
jgi:hypothetical protein